MNTISTKNSVVVLVYREKMDGTHNVVLKINVAIMQSSLDTKPPTNLITIELCVYAGILHRRRINTITQYTKISNNRVTNFIQISHKLRHMSLINIVE